MAKIVPGSPIADIRNKLGTVVYSRNRWGLYSRALVTPTNPSTTLQQTFRAAFQAASQRWSNTLTDAQRRAWQNFAFRLGQSFKLTGPGHLTGYHLFVRCNYYDQILNGDFLDDPPDAPKTPQLLSFTASGSVTGNTLNLSWTATTTDASTGILVRASQPLSPGRTRPDGTWAYVTEKLTNQSQPYNAWTEYLAHHTTPTAGTKTFLQAMVFDFGTFLPSVYLRAHMTWQT